MTPLPGDHIAVWFSCGAASAVAAWLTVKKYGRHCTVRLLNNPVKEEDSDNRRFLADCEAHIGIKIESVINTRYPHFSAVKVWDEQRFMAGVGGARCTKELKRVARQVWETQNRSDWLVLGFTVEERRRHDGFILTERSELLPILIDANLTKQDCFEIVEREWRIELPRIYKLGYPNANCIGCVKAASPTYWNHVRKIHPEVFKERAEQSRELGARLVKVNNERIFLDELSPDTMGRPMKTLQMPDCGIFCEERPFESRPQEDD